MLGDEHAYQTTSAELAVRIQMRDTILLGLVGAAATVIGILVPLEPMRQRSAIVIPFVVFIATLMIFHHDRIILLNAQFLRELELRHAAAGSFWHTHRHYGKALFARLQRLTASRHATVRTQASGFCSNWARRSQARMNASWTASCASERSPVMAYSWPTIRPKAAV